MSRSDAVIWISRNGTVQGDRLCTGTGKLEGSDKPVKRTLTVDVNYLDLFLTTCTPYEPVCFSTGSYSHLQKTSVAWTDSVSSAARATWDGVSRCELFFCCCCRALAVSFAADSRCVLLCGRVGNVTQAECYQGLFLSCVWYCKNVEDVFHHENMQNSPTKP